MTRVEIDRLTINFEIHKQNKGENAPGFVFSNSVAEARDQRGNRFGIVGGGDDGIRFARARLRWQA